MAEAVRPGAQYNQALAYAREAHGQEIPDERNAVEAVRWYRLAAKQGCQRAAYNLALLLDQGPIALRDPAGAFHWYEFAAERGDAAAMGNAGLCCLIGRGVPQQMEEAFIWLTSALRIRQTCLHPLRDLALECLLGGGGDPKYLPANDLFAREPVDMVCARRNCDHTACQSESDEATPAESQSHA
ncbi:MAG: tetratricopeptide repeat protein [Bryobacteraceae bacterium]